MTKFWQHVYMVVNSEQTSTAGQWFILQATGVCKNKAFLDEQLFIEKIIFIYCRLSVVQYKGLFYITFIYIYISKTPCQKYLFPYDRISFLYK